MISNIIYSSRNSRKLDIKRFQRSAQSDLKYLWHMALMAFGILIYN